MNIDIKSQIFSITLFYFSILHTIIMCSVSSFKQKQYHKQKHIYSNLSIIRL